MPNDLLLPIADIVINPWIIIAVGFIGGVFTGLLGVGGGIFITPTLFILGIPPVMAVASQVNSMIGVTLAGYLRYKRNDDVDYSLGKALIVSGIIGIGLGIYFLNWLGSSDRVQKLITSGYAILIACMAVLLLRQSIKNLKQQNCQDASQSGSPLWITKLPFVYRFSKTGLNISFIVLIATGIINGLLIAIFGVGNGIFMMPVLIYLLGKSSPVGYGTTLLSSAILNMASTFAHAVYNDLIDLLLVALLSIGGALGGRLGVKYSYKISRVYLGFAGAAVMVLMLLQVSIKICFPEVFTFPQHADMSALRTDFHLWIRELEDKSPLLYACIGIALSAALTYIFQFITSMLQRFKSSLSHCVQ
ncbi:sulfite exporter TauE/SafE family protein [Candidatus Odyssella thessalonicensis]|uniref:sulfite exporter TauE/SafE family protein n=1 Tax=Candidatus Odyssella thessalonicensis TaxID=84647 RepID=UPI000225A966|nr:sulfite exporter TauE/SafE family protein [Candidatus Odyssella thessalonicensis]